MDLLLQKVKKVGKGGRRGGMIAAGNRATVPRRDAGRKAQRIMAHVGLGPMRVVQTYTRYALVSLQAASPMAAPNS